MSEVTVTINGQKYTALPLLVTKSDDNGRPREFRALYPDESIKIDDGLEFAVVFIQSSVIEKVS